MTRRTNIILTTFISSLGLLIIVAVGACKDNNPPVIPTQNLKMINSYEMDFPEPSGLSQAFNSHEFYTVSDKANRVYLIDTAGNVKSTLNYHGEDLEGVTIRASDKSIWVGEEMSREVVQLNEEGDELARWALEYTVYSDKGLEGIAYNSINSHFYLLNESDPGLLIEWTPELGIIKTTTLRFASDYSGICCSMDGNALWIVSDESQTLNKTDLSGTLLEKYSHGFQKVEGVTLVNNEVNVYAVSDLLNYLYVFGFE